MAWTVNEQTDKRLLHCVVATLWSHLAKESNELNQALWTNCDNNHSGVERSSSAAGESSKEAADGRVLQLSLYLAS